VDVSVRIVSSKQPHELLRGVSPIHVQSEKAAIFAANCSGRSLELRSVVLPDCTIVSYEI